MKKANIKIAVTMLLIAMISGCFTIYDVDQPAQAGVASAIVVTISASTDETDTSEKFGLLGLQVPDDFTVNSIAYDYDLGVGTFHYLHPDSLDGNIGGQIDSGSVWIATMESLYPSPTGMHWEVWQSDSSYMPTTDTNYVDFTINMTTGATEAAYGMSYIFTDAGSDFTDADMWDVSLNNTILVTDASSGDLQTDIVFTVVDSTESYEKIMVKGSMTAWDTVQCYDDGLTSGDAVAGDFVWTCTIADVDTGSYEWGAFEDDGSEYGIWLIDGSNRLFTVHTGGLVTGQTNYVVPPLPAVAYQVTFTVNMTTTSITDSAVTGFYVSGGFNGWSQNDSLTAAGDYWSKTVEVLGDATGAELAYKFRYTDTLGDEYWESIDDRTATVTSDTSFFAYWDNIAPFIATDDLDVWFRVNMEGVAGFDSAAATVGVRGGEAPLDWGADALLDKEGESYFYSGLLSFIPDSSLGDLIEYKFVYDQSGLNWEGVDNRTFTLNVDTTLAFSYFNDEPPTGQTAVTAFVYFTVDMAAYEDMGLFSVVRQDSVQVRGGFNGWSSAAAPDGSDLKANRITGTTIYELNAPVTKYADTDDAYKYYIKMSQESLDDFAATNPYFYGDMGYENPPVEGAGNRTYIFEGDPSNAQMIGLQYYNGLPLAGIVPDGQTISLTHSVDMSGPISQSLFDAATDSLWLIYHDHWSLHLSGFWTSDDYRNDDLKLNDGGTDGDASAGDQIYTVTFDITGKIPFYMMYTYQFAGPSNALEEGGGFDFGRYRIRYIQPTGTVDNLTYPTAWVFPQDTWTTDPPLTVETPPNNVFVGTENEINQPTEFTVFQNYPNPFNPTTEMKFTLPEAGVVTMNIYNILGQKIVSYSNNFSSPGTYGLRWNGTDNYGQAVSSGIYFYEIQTTNHRITKKMTLLK